MSVFSFSFLGCLGWLAGLEWWLTAWNNNSITGSVYAEVTRMCLSLSFVSGDILEMERRAAAMLAQIAA